MPAIQRFVNARVQRPDDRGSAARCRPTTCRCRRPAATSRRSQRSSRCRCRGRIPDAGTLRASARAIEESLPDAVGAFIAWLVDRDNGWQVAERGADGTGERLVPIEPRHIAILFRRFVSFGDDVTRAYTDAIEARGMPHLLVGGKAFHGREEVETMRAALAAIEWPDDELSVFATLKGSLFAIDDEQLLEFRDRFGDVPSVPDSKGARRQLAARARARRRADGAPDADRGRAAAAADAASRPQLPSGRRHDRPAARGDARARRIHPAAGGRAGARQRAARRGARAPVRSVGRHLVPRLHRRAADGGRIGSRGSADSRREQRRRAPDDGAQGEGARVPGRDPRRPHLPDQPHRCEPLSRRRRAASAR